LEFLIVVIKKEKEKRKKIIRLRQDQVPQMCLPQAFFVPLIFILILPIWYLNVFIVEFYKI
jgi:hypothetical protein